jgi:hypothetical protein
VNHKVVAVSLSSGAGTSARVLDSIYVIEQAMQHFFLRAKNADRKQADVDDDYRQAAALAP